MHLLPYLCAWSCSKILITFYSSTLHSSLPLAYPSCLCFILSPSIFLQSYLCSETSSPLASVATKDASNKDMNGIVEPWNRNGKQKPRGRTMTYWTILMSIESSSRFVIVLVYWAYDLLCMIIFVFGDLYHNANTGTNMCVNC